MKCCWFAVPLAAWIFVGCAPDRTLDSLVPRDALAVVLVDHPGPLVKYLDLPLNGLPLGSLDGDRSWGAFVVPGAPPGFRLLLALANDHKSWDSIREWAGTSGGLVAERVGGYAVLSTPGLGAVARLAPDQRFDLGRVRTVGQPVNLYVNVAQALADPRLPPELLASLAQVPGVADQLAGLQIGLGTADGLVELSVTTDWKAQSPWGRHLRTWSVPEALETWSPPRVTKGVAISLSLPPQGWAATAALVSEAPLRERWTALASVLGPRAVVSAVPRADGNWAWSAAVESKDPQAFRQALKTLVASGDLQGQFGAWALDPDTPLIYQDHRDPLVGVTTTVSLGNQKLLVGYGSDRIALSGGDGAPDRLRTVLRPSAAPRLDDLPPRTLAAGSVSTDDVGATGSVALGPDGNLTLRMRVDQASLAFWAQRLPLLRH